MTTKPTRPTDPQPAGPDAQEAAGRRPSPPPGLAAGRRGDGRGSTRRHFFLTVAVAAAGLGCRASPAAEPALPRATPDRPPRAEEAVDPSIRAVRDHVLRLESPPAFVFTTKFRDVP